MYVLTIDNDSYGYPKKKTCFHFFPKKNILSFNLSKKKISWFSGRRKKKDGLTKNNPAPPPPPPPPRNSNGPSLRSHFNTFIEMHIISCVNKLRVLIMRVEIHCKTLNCCILPCSACCQATTLAPIQEININSTAALVEHLVPPVNIRNSC